MFNPTNSQAHEIKETTDGEPVVVKVAVPDFLAGVEAADPESFNVCISCD